MSERFLTPAELHCRLAHHGHTPWPGRADGIDVWPPPEIIVTVGLYPDPTLERAYRERYFACAVDEQERPVAEFDSVFRLPRPLAVAAAEESNLNGFLRGPLRWLSTRLGRYPRVLLWPGSQLRDPDGGGFAQPGLLDDVPCLRQWLDRGPSAAVVGATVLDLSEQLDCRVLWAAARLVGGGFQDFFVADEEGSEVYCLHHHDKVVVSIPDQHSRSLLLEELTQWSALFEDWSRYDSPMDEEEVVPGE